MEPSRGKMMKSDNPAPDSDWIEYSTRRGHIVAAT